MYGLGLPGPEWDKKVLSPSSWKAGEHRGQKGGLHAQGPLAAWGLGKHPQQCPGALPVHGQPTPRAGHWLTPALGRQPGEYGVKHPAAWAEHLVIL